MNANANTSGYVCVLGNTKLALFKNAHTFFNHVGTLSNMQFAEVHNVFFLKKSEVKVTMTKWSDSNDETNQLLPLPSPYPNFNTFTWKQASVNSDPMKCTRSMLKSTLMSQPTVYLKISPDVHAFVIEAFNPTVRVHLKQGVCFFALLHGSHARQTVNVNEAIHLIGDVPLPPIDHFSPNKRRKLNAMMPTTPMTPILSTSSSTQNDDPCNNHSMSQLELNRSSSTISYVNLLSPGSRASITSNLDALYSSPEKEGMLDAPTLSPSFKMEFTQNVLVTPVKFLHTDKSAYSPTSPAYSPTSPAYY